MSYEISLFYYFYSFMVAYFSFGDDELWISKSKYVDYLVFAGALDKKC